MPLQRNPYLSHFSKIIENVCFVMLRTAMWYYFFFLRSVVEIIFEKCGRDNKIILIIVKSENSDIILFVCVCVFSS